MWLNLLPSTGKPFSKPSKMYVMDNNKNKAAEAAQDWTDKLENKVEEVKDKAEEVWDKVEDKAEEVLDAAKEKAGELAEGAKNLWNKLVDKIDGDDEPAEEKK